MAVRSIMRRTRAASFPVLLGLIVVVALAGRIVYVCAVTSQEKPPFALPLQDTGDAGANAKPIQPQLVRSFDEYYYQFLAVNIANGNGFVDASGNPDAVHPPLTAVILAPVARFYSDNEIAMRLPVAFAGAGVVALAGVVAFGVAGRRAGLLAAALAAVYPNLWLHDGLLMSETFAALTTLGIVYCTYRLIRKPSWGRAAALGVAIALGMLVRAEFFLFLPLLLVPLALWVLPAGRRLRLVTTVVVVAAVVVAPWVSYNMGRFERPVFISYGDGPTLAGANCDTTYSGRLLGYWNAYCVEPHTSTDPSVRAAQDRSAAIRYMKGHLSRLPVVVGARVGRMWTLYKPITMLREWQFEGKLLWASLTGLTMSVPLLGLAAYAVVLLRRRRVPVFPLLAPPLVVTIVAAAFYGLLRNRVTAEVAVVVLAGIALDALTVRRRTRAEPVETKAIPAGVPD